MKVGIVQDGPVYLDAEGTFDKTVDYLNQAKRDEVDLIVFGESWFSGYPVWLDVCADISLWDHPPVKDVWHQMFQNGLSADGDMIKDLRAAIAKAGIYVVIGANEPVSKGPNNGTIFNTIYTFDHQGTLVNHHRKLVPTYTEKLVHGHGDGYGLRGIDTPKGRIGSLVCWEHWMPLTRQAMHDEGEDLHIALWPHVKETHHLASRHYAHEGRCHVVAVGQVMHHDELPSQL
ncbi:MAG: nitrilase-related carbon-nitrogen hydrolase, partial [Bacteroidota bacterium]